MQPGSVGKPARPSPSPSTASPHAGRVIWLLDPPIEDAPAELPGIDDEDADADTDEDAPRELLAGEDEVPPMDDTMAVEDCCDDDDTAPVEDDPVALEDAREDAMVELERTLEELPARELLTPCELPREEPDPLPPDDDDDDDEDEDEDDDESPSPVHPAATMNTSTTGRAFPRAMRIAST